MIDFAIDNITYPQFNKTVHYYHKAIIELVERHPLNKISVQMICDETLTSKSTFYKYFPHKFALINYVFLHDVEDILDYMYDDEQSYLKALTIFFQRTIDKKDFYKKISSAEGPDSFQDFYIKFWYEFNKRTILKNNALEAIEGSDIEHTLLTFNYGLSIASFAWFKKGCSPHTPEEKAQLSLNNLPTQLLMKNRTEIL